MIFTLLLSFHAFSATPVTLACKSSVEDWVKVVPTNVSTLTCQAIVERSYDYGKCTKKEGYWDGDRYIENCQKWATVSWTKTARLVCGGANIASASQTCSAPNTDTEGADKANKEFDHSISSIFIEQMAQQGFDMVRTDPYGSSGRIIYFQKRK